MIRLLPLPLMLLIATTVCAAHGPEVIDPAEAEKDPDFAIQGEYVGEGVWPENENHQEKSEKSEKCKIGTQVIAQGDGKFNAVVFKGGLPGDGWNRGDEQYTIEGRREGEDAVASFKQGDRPAGKIADGVLTLFDAEVKEHAKLKRTGRKSPALEAKPPGDAVVIFDGTNLEHFPDGKITDMKTLEAGCTMKPGFKMKKLHLEFRLSWKPTARGQGRSNSGVYIGGMPEIQVLDSFGLEGTKNECGALYGRRVPDVNMCLPPLVWQTFDVEFTEPERDEKGNPKENIRATVRHNGIVIHKDYDTRKKESGPRRLHLQRHGNRVQYRNIWIVEPE